MISSDILTKRARLALVCTGAGAGIQQSLWNIPGISAVLADSSFPYAPEATSDYLGFTPGQFCSEATAIDLAMAAYYRAYKPGAPPAVGVGLTASVASLKAHRGDHRAHAAYFSDTGCKVYTVILEKGVGAEQRGIDGQICDSLAERVIQDALGLPSTATLGCAETDGAAFAQSSFMHRPFFSKEGLRAETFPLERVAPFGAVLPGTFNPPHEGHFGMASAYSQNVGGPVLFAIEATPPHKEALRTAEMLQRAKMLKGQEVLFTEGAGLYLDKARRFPGMGMILGADALVQMLDPKWGVSTDELVCGLSQTTLYVVDREIGGKLLQLEQVKVPVGIRCKPLRGRWDVSSSELRSRSATALSVESFP